MFAQENFFLKFWTGFFLNFCIKRSACNSLVFKEERFYLSYSDKKIRHKPTLDALPHKTMMDQ